MKCDVTKWQLTPINKCNLLNGIWRQRKNYHLMTYRLIKCDMSCNLMAFDANKNIIIWWNVFWLCGIWLNVIYCNDLKHNWTNFQSMKCYLTKCHVLQTMTFSIIEPFFIWLNIIWPNVIWLNHHLGKLVEPSKRTFSSSVEFKNSILSSVWQTLLKEGFFKRLFSCLL